MKVLCVDYGTKRVGLAISDDTGAMAFPLETISSTHAIENICHIIREKKVTQLVVGLPIHMDGREGNKSKEAREFGKQLERTTGLIPEYVDETLSTYEAEQELKERKMSPKKRKQVIDQVAAQKVLQEFLDHKKRTPKL